mgnify:CR=1 FL=1
MCCKGIENMNISEFKYLIAQSEFTPKEIIEFLAKDEDWRIRASVARNLKTLKEILEIIIKNK